MAARAVVNCSGRDRHPLAEGHGDPVDDGAGLAEIAQQPAALSRDRDAAFAAEAELPEILIQADAAQFVGDLGRADIARFLDDLLHRQAPVGMHVVDHILAIYLPMAAFTIIAVAGLHHVGVQGRGHHENLVSGTGLQTVGDQAVAPGIFGKLAITIGVHGGQLGHGQDLPGLRLQHQGGAAGGVIFFHPPGQFFFGDILQGAVQGEDHVVPHDLRVPGLLPRGDDMAPGIHGLPALLGFAVELFIELVLYAFQTLAVNVAEPQDLSGQRELRIVALGLGDQIDGIGIPFAGDLGGLVPAVRGGGPGQEGGFPLRGQLALDPDKVSGPGENLLQFPGLVAQDGRPVPGSNGRRA